MHPVSHVVDEPLPALFEATMRIRLGGGTLELTNHADTALVASILSMVSAQLTLNAYRRPPHNVIGVRVCKDIF